MASRSVSDIGGKTALIRFSRGKEIKFWRISGNPKITVGSKKMAQAMTPQAKLKPSARVNTSMKAAVIIARVLKGIEYRAVASRSANKPDKKTNIFKIVS
jgi:hypothetical protein